MYQSARCVLLCILFTNINTITATKWLESNTSMNYFDSCRFIPPQKSYSWPMSNHFNHVCVGQYLKNAFFKTHSAYLVLPICAWVVGPSIRSWVAFQGSHPSRKHPPSSHQPLIASQLIWNSKGIVVGKGMEEKGKEGTKETDLVKAYYMHVWTSQIIKTKPFNEDMKLGMDGEVGWIWE